MAKRRVPDSVKTAKVEDAVFILKNILCERGSGGNSQFVEAIFPEAHPGSSKRLFFSHWTGKPRGENVESGGVQE